MEYLEQPGIKETYEKCKLIVKVWEHKFTKQYKRIPSKLDIREASSDVRHAYRKYFQLKTTALEQSFKDVEGFEDDDDCSDSFSFSVSQLSTVEQFDTPLKETETTRTETDSPKPLSPLQEKIQVPKEVWGSHLNHKIKEDKKDKEEKKENPNLSITKKLFCGSKFTKRNPRKSLSFSHKTKSNINVDDTASLSQPTLSKDMRNDFTLSKSINHFPSFDTLDETLSQNENWFSKDSYQIENNLSTVQSQPLNIIQSVLEDKCKPIKTIDTGWLQRVAHKTGITIEQQEQFVPQTAPFRLLDKTGKPVSFLSHPHAAAKETISLNTVENTRVDYDSDDIIEESDDETSKNISTFHVSKKRKIQPPPQAQLVSVETENANSEKQANFQSQVETDNCMDVEDYQTIVRNSKQLESNSEVDTVVKQSENVIEQEQVTVVSKAQKKKHKTTPKPKKQPPKKSMGKTKAVSKNKPQDGAEVTPRRSARETKVKVSLQELSSGEEEPFANDEELDPEFDPKDENNKKSLRFLSHDDEESCENDETPEKIKRATKAPRTRKPSKPKKLPNEESIEANSDQDEQTSYDLEFSVKPRIAAPRYANLKEILADNKIKTKSDATEKTKEIKETNEIDNPVKGQRQLAKEALEKKIASGSLNNNFVRINIQKKVFVRGKSGRSFSKFKKAQWKANKKARALCGPEMDMGGCDGGMLTCFNCGGTGHFARNCKAHKGDSLLPTNAEMEEEECPFPTLEEASQMAQGVLKIRDPKLVCDSHNDEGGEEPRDNDEDKVIDSSQEDVDDDCFDDDVDSDLLLLETLKLEEHVRKLDVQQYLDKVKVVEPYFQPNEDGSVIATPPEVYEVLNQFGHSSFRPGQEQAVMRILSGKSTLVTLSTGSGKSLCYQLPAYLYSKREPCISLIISPLVSLMDDQVMGIAKFMKAACLHSNQTKIQRQKILEMISNGELSVLLVSPEAVVAGERQTGFGSFLRRLPPIAFACIDEAHCVSQWSHNFRPSYLLICRVLRESLGVRTILGLTATATRATKESIIRHLCISDGDSGVISDIPLPDNLMLSASKDAERDYALLRLLMSDRFTDCKSIIIYCTRRDECERVASFLRTSLKSQQPVASSDKKRKRVNLQAEPYHAGLSASRRRTIQNTFMSGMLRIVVATVAFGMGINKSDIRAVIHYNMPKSFESYVQEVGRAGRDGLKAHCHVFLDSRGKDESELRRHIHSNSIERHTIRKLLQKVFVPCSCKGVCFKHEVAFSTESTVRELDIPDENISTLLCYLELHPNKYVELLSPAYTWCKIISYGGPLQIRKVAKDCPPLAMALALHRNKTGDDPNILEFPVIEIASAMGWESGICKHKLKNLEWITVNNQPKRSSISVQFSNLGFRLLAPGNLSEDQLDEALDNLYNRVVEQERTALLQLNAVHATLTEVAKATFSSSSIEEDDCVIKKRIREYFNSSDPLSAYSSPDPKPINEEQLVSDVHAIIYMYKDNNFTGRAIARILQGIQSPNYPAVIWGRSKFWRSYLEADFHTIMKIATREIIKIR